MEPINQFLKNSKKIKDNNDKLYDSLIQHPRIIELIENSDFEITRSMIRNDLLQLKRYTEQSLACEKCSSLGECINHPQGYVPSIDVRGGRIHIIYSPCPTKIKDDAFREKEKMIESYHVPKDVKDATFETVFLDPDSNRQEIIKRAISTSKKVIEGIDTKGLYIHGSFGIGKSYLLGCIANELKDQSVSSIIVYLPEIIRDLKAGFKDGTTDKKFNTIKNAQVLMLDDLGAEDVTPWVRDEIITGILHHRMVEGLPTFVSSNYSIEELEYRYSRTRENGVEETKARRMTERLRALCEEVQLEGSNYRNN
ncbi:primosomal protein DnaI [Salinicoccus roseus]|uniref:primosomal protein DnaI n=1 Tax=Salinicoccus roseus TaxID=45670 RepID=UPI001EF45648|nr:primosomal protein DnaI [Salinicoccus roseus]MCG7332183.1 primosomal protein DnaI [Salinicoccus roseus]